ncbi:GlsB/YeaQ/YmgE family stress response membrane protein [Candidatus Frankia alpina]|uniref:GlsB/YeaQ/YmgE family stress response membrane protein n=1 Tax=Candidatus Frankia alpina TaxID=2699483 RepID=A0A4S5D033_9ACTN|nr:GlsB/YeaQ/YmgE family stress response membrane protein [Candidatus Frankia alpina]THJ51939.1 GlsB/YeaQ/YmgE family stress response membrane protein [Candidatus Frankia alpina]
MFQIIWIIIAGLVIGLLARLILRGRQDIPLWLTAVLGIVGALVGNVIASAIGVRHTGGVDWIRHVLQVGVALALVAAAAPMWATRHTRGDHHNYHNRHDRHTAGRL